MKTRVDDATGWHDADETREEAYWRGVRKGRISRNLMLCVGLCVGFCVGSVVMAGRVRGWW